jgi:hypothetical protein
MIYVDLDYRGALLSVPLFVAPLWPHDLDPGSWPTFCGAGEAAGDWIIPDSVRGVSLAPACFVHDLDWATSPDTVSACARANLRFLGNCLAMIKAARMGWPQRQLSRLRCLAYFAGVSVGGLFCFDPSGWQDGEDPFENPVVRSRLQRLARVHIGLEDRLS